MNRILQRLRQLYTWPVLVAGTLCTSAAIADYEPFPGSTRDASTLRIQEQVENLYNEQQFLRARLIYEKQLAPRGDKYAQYMVGYMTLTGRGTAPDPALALAWYRLAAERDERPYVQARDALAAELAADAQERAAQLFAEMRPHYGDRRLLLSLMKEDLALLKRLGDGASGQALVSGFLGGTVIDHAALARERLAKRLAYLERLPGEPALRDEEQRLRDAVTALPD